MSTPLPASDAGALRDTIRDALVIELPRKVDLLRAERGWTEIEMPHVEQIRSGEPVEQTLVSMESHGGTWVVILNPRLLRMSQVDIDPRGLPVYMSTYVARLQLFARAADWDTSMTVRDHLALATKLALWEWPNLKPGVYGDTGYRVRRESYTERNLEPMRQGNAGGRVWTPALITVDIDVEEAVSASTRPPLGEAETVEQGAYAVGPGQPMQPPE